MQTPDKPTSISQDGPKCAGTAVTFSATLPAKGATGLSWRGSVTGAGTSTTSDTAPKDYYAEVRAYNTAPGIKCYSTTISTTGTIVDTPDAPTLSRSAASVCEGSGITFTAADGNGTYVWSGTGISGSGSVATSGTDQGY